MQLLQNCWAPSAIKDTVYLIVNFIKDNRNHLPLTVSIKICEDISR